MVNIENRTPTTPNPDPTAATATALLREITNSKELNDVLVKNTREIVAERIKGVDEVLTAKLVCLTEELHRQPSLVQQSFNQLREVTEEKFKVQDEQFKSVQTQFRERDTRTDQKEKDNKVAIDAALSAQKESVNKTETTFTKQIDEIGKRIDTVSKGADEKISDLKERIQAVESHKKGSSDVWLMFIGIAGAVVAVVLYLATRHAL